jgi:tetratricopeptide (TPR) repeat protein
VARQLAWHLATDPDPEIRDAAEAIRLAERVCRTTKNVPIVLDTLAAAYANAGKFDEAIKVAECALQLASASHDVLIAEALESRLKLYHARRPYREPTQEQGP